MLPSTLSTLIIFVASAVAQNECYYAANKRAGSAIIPCGTGTYSACCQIGDLCLSDGACWNPTHNVTYLYGCTDPNYADSTCPWKCGSDFDNAPYVGLDYCSNTTQNEWSCTHPPSNSDSIQPFPAQECLDDSIIAFAGPSSLQPILSLPTDIGGSTEWFSEVNPTSYILDPNYTPTTTSIQVTASVPVSVQLVYTSTGSVTTASSGQTTPTSPGTAALAHTDSGLSTGAKIGIGVGVGTGGLGLIALAGAALLIMRRRRSSNGTLSSAVEKAEVQRPGSRADIKASLLGPPGELPGSDVNSRTKLQDSAGYGDATAVRGWESPAPEYSATQKPAMQDEPHEME
ncbi:hypothetical protein PV11_04325 [Exophiala sideris]|uniref:Mid2 domain-containing protein n=1 Tax=Exophiala sideris TaxID=1016849 RepID=A0A0D1Z5Q5_9EURO|nr:hypothetical protein PV11_04325 [Exophiala sideris]